METSHDVQATLAALYQGSHLKLSFPTALVRENFRKSLYRFKGQQDEIIQKLLGEKPKILRIEKPTEYNDVFPFSMILWLREDLKIVKFEILAPTETFESKDA